MTLHLFADFLQSKPTGSSQFSLYHKPSVNFGAQASKLQARPLLQGFKEPKNFQVQIRVSVAFDLFRTQNHISIYILSSHTIQEHTRFVEFNPLSRLLWKGNLQEAWYQRWMAAIFAQVHSQAIHMH